jgi:hypothetical protein
MSASSGEDHGQLLPVVMALELLLLLLYFCC